MDSAFVAVWARGRPDVGQIVAREVGLSVADAQLRTSGGLPRVVQRYEDPQQAQAVSARLREAGMASLAFTSADVERWPLVTARTFALDAQGVVAETRAGRSYPLAFSGMRAIHKGRVQISGTTETSTTTKQFSMGKAVLTGGLAVRTTVTEKQRESTYASWHVVVCSTPQGALLFDEQDTQFNGLPPPLPPGRFACLGVLEGMVRRAAPHARYDDALLRAEQTRNDATAVLGEGPLSAVWLGAWLMGCLGDP